MSSIKRRTGELAEALDSVEQGIVIVTDDLRLVHGNVAAGRILREGDALASQAGRLTTTMPAVRARLEALLYLALHGDGLGARPGGSLACERRSGRRPYAVHVLPLTAQQTEFASHGPAAMVVIVDPERRPRPATETLRVLFGLTKTEAAVAQLVMNGEGLGPIGEQLSLSNDTVKTHLRNVFHKTDTHRQAELVRLLVAITV